MHPEEEQQAAAGQYGRHESRGAHALEQLQRVCELALPRKAVNQRTRQRRAHLQPVLLRVCKQMAKGGRGNSAQRPTLQQRPAVGKLLRSTSTEQRLAISEGNPNESLLKERGGVSEEQVT